MNRNQVPSAAEFGGHIALLSRNGMTAQAARTVIGSNPNGRTRAQIANVLREWLKELPKAAL